MSWSARWSRAVMLLVCGHIALTWVRAVRRGFAARARSAPAAPPESDGAPAAPVSIIVPAWRERGTIEACVRALQRIHYPAWEAIVVAGGPDGTYEAALAATVGDPRFRVERQEPRGKNAALNAGVAVAQHELIVVLDADAVVDPDWLGWLVAPLLQGMSATMGNFFPRRPSWVSLAEQMTKIEAYELLGSTSLQGSGSIGLQRAALARIGGFPDDVPVGVDWDLGVRLADAGEPIAFAGRAHLRTERPATPRELWTNDVRWQRAYLRGLRRHRASLLTAPAQALWRLYFFGLSGGLAAAAALGLLLGIARPATRPALARGAGWGVLWLMGRRAAQGAQIAAFTRDARWLRLAWAPALLLPVQVASAVWAMATMRRATFHFKGPRPADPASSPFDPVAIDTSNALDYAGLLVFQRRPRTIRLATPSTEIAIAAVRRLPWFTGTLFVENASVRDAVLPHRAGRVEIDAAVRADLRWSLFAERLVDGGEASLVVVERNGLSYPLLLGRVAARSSTPSTVWRLTRARRIQERAGILTPPFLWRWAISLAAGPRFPGLHFLVAQRAMEHVIDRSILWWSGAVIVLCAESSGHTDRVHGETDWLSPASPEPNGSEDDRGKRA